MDTKRIKLTALAAALSAALLASGARAAGGVWDNSWTPENGFGGLSSSWSSTAAGSARAEWNVFNSATFDDAPDVGSFGLGTAFVSELTGGAFLVGGANIYSFSVATSFITSIEGASMSASGVRDVALRIGTLGTSLKESSVLLDGAAPTSRLLDVVGSSGPMGGDENEWVFVWKNVANTGAPLTFAFEATESSMSLDQLAMYYSPTVAVPEANEWALMLAGLGVVGLASRRRRNGGQTIG